MLFLPKKKILLDEQKKTRLIENMEIWISYIDLRKNTVHEYLGYDIYNYLPLVKTFLSNFLILIEKLKKFMNNKTFNQPSVCIKYECYNELKRTVNQFSYQFYAYGSGSRVRGDNEEYSNLDICIFEPFKSFEEQKQIKYVFSKYNLPISVSVISWPLISEAF